MDELLCAIEATSRAIASQTCELVHVAPFVVLIHPNDPAPWFNYAMPVADLTHTAEALMLVQSIFQQRQRRLRFEWTQELWPQLLAVLQEFGLTAEHLSPQMVCTPATFQAYQQPEVQVRLLEPSDDLNAYLRLMRLGFGSTLPVTAPDVRELHIALNHGWRYAVAQTADVWIGVGGYCALGEMTELIAIATHPHYRRRGVARTLTSFLVADHFAHGGTLAYLYPADPTAESTYQKLGFQVIAHRLSAVEE